MSTETYILCYCDKHDSVNGTGINNLGNNDKHGSVIGTAINVFGNFDKHKTFWVMT